MDSVPILTITISAGKPSMPPGSDRDISDPMVGDMGGDDLALQDPQDMTAEKDMVSPARIPTQLRSMSNNRGGPGGPKPRGI